MISKIEEQVLAVKCPVLNCNTGLTKEVLLRITKGEDASGIRLDGIICPYYTTHDKSSAISPYCNINNNSCLYSKGFNSFK